MRQPDRSFRRPRVLAILVLALGATLTASAVASAVEIVSTTTGGLWTDFGTWVGGVVPASGDDVVIAGPVTVPATQSCQSLDVAAAGTLASATGAPCTLDVAGAVQNQGAIQDGPFWFTLRVGGDLSNAGTWSNHESELTGVVDQRLDVATGFVMASDITRSSGATGDLIVATPFITTRNVDLGTGRMILEPDSPFTLAQGWFAGELLAGGNELRFESFSYLVSCNVHDAVLIGLAQASAGVRFTGQVTIAGTLQNLPSGGSSAVLIDGDLINLGLIRNHTYGLTISLSGDLTNDGVIANSNVSLEGDSEHHLSMGPDGDMATLLFLPEFGAGTIIGDTDLHFSDGVALGAGGTMVLAPGSTLRLTGSGSVSGGTLLAGGSVIDMQGTGALSVSLIDQAILRGQVQVLGSPMFTGGVTIEGTLQNWEFADAEVTVEGALVNEGVIRDNVRSLAVIALGDVENRGQWENARVELAGSADQTTGIGGGIEVPEFVLQSGIVASGYQWLKDGEPLPGATSPDLLFVTVGTTELGSYVCLGDEGQTSRAIVLEEGGVTSVGGVPLSMATPLAVLHQNRPNPFRPMTEIRFDLVEAGAVELAVYDVAGRRVSLLVSEERSAGRHVVAWRPDAIAAGVYFIRLRAGDTELIRKTHVMR